MLFPRFLTINNLKPKVLLCVYLKTVFSLPMGLILVWTLSLLSKTCFLRPFLSSRPSYIALLYLSNFRNAVVSKMWLLFCFYDSCFLKCKKCGRGSWARCRRLSFISTFSASFLTTCIGIAKTQLQSCLVWCTSGLVAGLAFLLLHTSLVVKAFFFRWLTTICTKELSAAENISWE